ncbi:cilia- and flagella-associated protein 144 isoform X2 [Bos mutus]|uniref:cilia- and flagella-associated protein 144 isoform X2 n=1 Tax=Bos mutus TaxID=72004 RepID=UPI0038B612C4
MAGHQKEKAISDEVHQNQILRELYLKELRTQKLYTQYHFTQSPESPCLGMITWKNLQMTCREEHKKNPVPILRSLSNLLCFPRNAPRARFLNLIHHAAQGPRKKYPETQTEGQEIGWDSEPLGLARKSTRGHTSGDWDLSQVQVPTRQGLPPSPQASF